MKMKLMFIMVAVLLGLYANGQLSVRSKGDVSFTTFPKTIRVTTTLLVNTTDLEVRDMWMADNALILVNLKESNPSILSVVDLQAKAVLDAGLKRGYGANQLLVPIQTGLLPDNSMYLFDPMMKKLLHGTVGTNKKWQHKDTKLLQEGHYSFRLLNDSIGFGFGSHRSLGKIQRINVVSGAEKNVFGVFGNMPKAYKPGSWKHAHEGFLYVKPDGAKMVLVHRYFDKIEILNLQNNTSKSVVGPKNIALSATPFSTQGMDVIMTNEKTISTYTNGYATDKYIFCLFSNLLESDYNSEKGKDIFVFTWDGTPVAHLMLPEPISALAVSKDSKTFYGFSSKKQAIVSATLVL